MRYLKRLTLKFLPLLTIFFPLIIENGNAVENCEVDAGEDIYFCWGACIEDGNPPPYTLGGDTTILNYEEGMKVNWSLFTENFEKQYDAEEYLSDSTAKNPELTKALTAQTSAHKGIPLVLQVENEGGDKCGVDTAYFHIVKISSTLQARVFYKKDKAKLIPTCNPVSYAYDTNYWDHQYKMNNDTKGIWVRPDTDTTYNLIGKIGQCKIKTSFYVQQLTTQINPDKQISKGKNPFIKPNPAENYLRIENLPSESLSYTFQLFHLSGEALMKKEITSDENEINVKNFPAGLYQVKVSDKNNRAVLTASLFLK